MTEIFIIPDSYFAIIMVCWSPLHAHVRPIDEIQKFNDKKIVRVSEYQTTLEIWRATKFFVIDKKPPSELTDGGLFVTALSLMRVRRVLLRHHSAQPLIDMIDSISLY